MRHESDKVFVYGTLRRGFSLHKHLRKTRVRFLGKGKIRGCLYDLGEFPGACPSELPTDEVEGELYELIQPTEQLKVLDKIEEFDPCRPDESLFVRRLTVVELQTGQRVEAWVYFLPQKPSSARLIPSGDYAEARRRS